MKKSLFTLIDYSFCFAHIHTLSPSHTCSPIHTKAHVHKTYTQTIHLHKCPPPYCDVTGF